MANFADHLGSANFVDSVASSRLSGKGRACEHTGLGANGRGRGFNAELSLFLGQNSGVEERWRVDVLCLAQDFEMGSNCAYPHSGFRDGLQLRLSAFKISRWAPTVPIHIQDFEMGSNYIQDFEMGSNCIQDFEMGSNCTCPHLKLISKQSKGKSGQESRSDRHPQTLMK